MESFYAIIYLAYIFLNANLANIIVTLLNPDSLISEYIYMLLKINLIVNQFPRF